MRLFVALDIDDAIRARIARFLDGVRGFAPDARWVRPESVHITLKFIGEQPEDEAEEIKRVLETIHANTFEINIRGYGFFPGARMPRLFWIGIESTELASLTTTIDEKLAASGVPKEEHAFSPHLTLARGGRELRLPRKQKGDEANHSFQHLQEKLAACPAPEFGTITTREFFLYKSRLSPDGSRYTKLAAFALH